MTWIMCDIEADGPVPGLYSMIEIGCVAVMPGLEHSFQGYLHPLTYSWDEGALKSINCTREKTLTYPNPMETIRKLDQWISSVCGSQPRFISDNNGFDWQFVNYYFHLFLKRNPFGHSSTNLGSLYKGMVKDTFQSFKHLRDTPHTHTAVDDARGNAEALLKMADMGLKINLR